MWNTASHHNWLRTTRDGFWAHFLSCCSHPEINAITFKNFKSTPGWKSEDRAGSEEIFDGRMRKTNYLRGSRGTQEERKDSGGDGSDWLSLEDGDREIDQSFRGLRGVFGIPSRDFVRFIFKQRNSFKNRGIFSYTFQNSRFSIYWEEETNSYLP